ncbi:MAG: alanine racemase [Clostridia bacterium]|nr:alanine racemase [Clostridia bacterium]
MENEAYKLYSSLPMYGRHKTWAEIDLDALKHNYKLIKDHISSSSEARLICVLKADAYGHGADACARVLLGEGCDFFAVSCIEEAVALRNVCLEFDKHADILLLGYTLPSSVGELVANDIIQTVFSPEYAKALNDEAKKQNCCVRVHIKLDTGMNRLGFIAQDKETVACAANDIAAVCALCNMKVEGMFTHFVSADEISCCEKDRTIEQYEYFAAVNDLLLQKGIKIPFKHVANSAAVVRYPNLHLDGVRAGILLYGARASEAADLPSLRPVMSLKTVVSHIHKLSAGKTVSYGGTFSSDSERTLATLPIGYADGFIRAFSGAEVSIETKSGEKVKANIVGRICMDQCMADVTDKCVNVGDIVTLFGEECSQIYDLAALAGTIDYECLCIISGRVPRVYK